MSEEPEQTTTLIPYHSATPTPILATETPQPPTAQPLPSPTPTYRVYEVKSGDDLGGIAFVYQVSLSDLLAVNPDVNAYAMSIGTVLNIPPTIENANDEEIQPTPVGVQIENPVCYSSEGAGTWCFSNAFNPFEQSVENVTAILRIQKAGQEHQQSYTMFPGLNTIPAQGKLPLMVYIAEDLGGSYSSNVDLSSALPLSESTDRYLPVELNDVQIQIISRATANASGTVKVLAESTKTAAEVWLLAVAYDAGNQIIGVRRLEMQVQAAPGTDIPFEFDVYIAGGSINHVELLVEAMP
ncbi:MAG: LysM peptidoglycan-binding domain-containing protein [Anaerolineaceae bacterium]|nr:LysM peptidoglycan-binding domain-containing protein [Anaerolineaceae bacterium]